MTDAGSESQEVWLCVVTTLWYPLREDGRAVPPETFTSLFNTQLQVAWHCVLGAWDTAGNKADTGPALMKLF